MVEGGPAPRPGALALIPPPGGAEPVPARPTYTAELMPATQWTKLNPRWLLKQFVVAILFTIFGLWGLYDAAIVYPARGVAYADYTKYQYLEQVKRKASGASWGDPSIADPKSEFERLGKEGASARESLVKAKYEWLEALATISRLQASNTAIPNPEQEHAALEGRFNPAGGAVSLPKKLDWWDLPVQWLICVLGLSIGGFMFAFAAMVARVKYGWNAEQLELTLPGGATLTVDQCEDFDRRKWDKFLMFIRVKAGHPTLGGQELKLDLLQYVPLEAWVVEMEYTAFPDRKVEAETAEAELPGPDPDSNAPADGQSTPGA